MISSISNQTNQNNLIQALATCRTQIEEKHAEKLEHLFARRRTQGLAVLSRLTLSKPHRNQDHHTGHEAMGKAIRSTELSAAQKDQIVRKIRANAHLSPHASPQRSSTSQPYDDVSPGPGLQSTPHYQDDSILSAKNNSIGKSIPTAPYHPEDNNESMGIQSPLRVSMTHEDVQILKVLNGDSVYEKEENHKSHGPIDLSRAKPRVLSTNYQESLPPPPTVLPARVLSNDVLVEVGLMVQKQKNSLIVVDATDINNEDLGDSNAAEESRKRLQRFEKMKIKKQQEAEQRQQQQRLRSQSAGRVRTGSGMPLSPQRQHIQQQEREMIQKKKILNDVPVEVRIGRRDADDVSIFSDNASASTDVMTRGSNRGGGGMGIHQRQPQRQPPATAMISSEPQGEGMEGKMMAEGYLATHLQLKAAAARDHLVQPSSLRTSNESDKIGYALIAAAPNTKRALSAGPTYRRPTGLSAPSVDQPIPHNQHLPIKTKSKIMSNVSQVKNAISHVCLAGTTFQQQREEALHSIEHWTQPRTYHIHPHPHEHDVDAQGNGGMNPDTTTVLSVTHFVILLYHAKSLSFRSIYAVDPMTNEMKKIHGRGPRILLETYVEGYFKYETSSKSFKALQTKTLTSTADAVSVDPSKLKKILGKD